MKSSDRAILVGILVAGAFAAFWFLALAPQREKAAELEDTIAGLESDISTQEQIVASGHQAQADYQRNFSSLVVLGKAAPADGDTPALLEQLVAINKQAKTRFNLLQLGTAPALPEAPAAPATTEGDEPPAEGEPATAESTTTSTTAAPAPATEASASSLPIGASVGSAGLAVLPYDMKFSGDFFQIADLFKGIDQMIGSKNVDVDVGGRLITVNGFKMTKEDAISPLAVELSISSYVLPQSQGLTAGATATMPPESVPAATTVAETAP